MDKNKTHIDNAFIDQSWQEMAKLLDKEMPVKKKDRKFLWLWFIGLGLILGLFFTYTFQKTKNDLESLKIPIEEPIANSENLNINGDGSNQTSDYNHKNISDSNIKSTPRKKKSTDAIHAINSNDNLTFTSTSEAITSALASEAGSFMVKERPIEKLSIPSTSFLEPINLIKENTALEQQLDKSEIRFGAFELIGIKTLAPKPILFASPEIAIPIVPIKMKKPLKIGIYLATNYPKLGGLNAGVFGNWQFHQKWALFFGIGYSKNLYNETNINQTIGNQDIVKAETEENSDNPLGTTVEQGEDTTTGTAGTATGAAPAPDDDTSSPMNDPVFGNSFALKYHSFHYFEMPLLLQYKIGNRWSVELGGQISRLHGFRYEQDGNAQFSSNLNATFDTFSSRADEENFADLSTINKWNYDILGGFSYKLSSKIGAFSQFQYGINNYLENSNQQNNKWKQIRLGLRINLN